MPSRNNTVPPDSKQYGTIIQYILGAYEPSETSWDRMTPDQREFHAVLCTLRYSLTHNVTQTLQECIMWRQQCDKMIDFDAEAQERAAARLKTEG